MQVSEAEQAVLDCFADGEFGLLDDIAERLGKPIAELSGILMSLELKRLIVKRVDGRFEAK